MRSWDLTSLAFDQFKDLTSSKFHHIGPVWHLTSLTSLQFRENSLSPEQAQVPNKRWVDLTTSTFYPSQILNSFKIWPFWYLTSLEFDQFDQFDHFVTLRKPAKSRISAKWFWSVWHVTNFEIWPVWHLKSLTALTSLTVWPLCVEILVEQQTPQGVLVCDHAGRVINKISLSIWENSPSPEYALTWFDQHDIWPVWPFWRFDLFEILRESSKSRVSAHALSGFDQLDIWPVWCLTSMTNWTDWPVCDSEKTQSACGD